MGPLSVEFCDGRAIKRVLRGIGRGLGMSKWKVRYGGDGVVVCSRGRWAKGKVSAIV